jgi:hypothetical protein
MKSVAILQTEYDANLKQMKILKELGKSYRSISKKNDQIKFFIDYLNTNPSEAYLCSEKQKIQAIISNKEAKFEHWSKNVCPQEVPTAKRRAVFNKEVGIVDLRKRLKTLNFILS